LWPRPHGWSQNSQWNSHVGGALKCVDGDGAAAGAVDGPGELGIPKRRRSSEATAVRRAVKSTLRCSSGRPRTPSRHQRKMQMKLKWKVIIVVIRHGKAWKRTGVKRKARWTENELSHELPKSQAWCCVVNVHLNQVCSGFTHTVKHTWTSTCKVLLSAHPSHTANFGTTSFPFSSAG
jgi:hypothetical protein